MSYSPDDDSIKKKYGIEKEDEERGGWKPYVEYGRQYTEEIIAYTLLVLGLILSITEYSGGLLVGLVAGYYFSEPVMRFLKHIKEEMVVLGPLRAVTAAIMLLVFLFATPSFFLGALIILVIKQIFSL